ncbi:MAG: glucose 1-dehydrogenase [Pirellulales bacterium]|nr:glucose 1-dehydrogenase [Pirellulales bacterium]
MKSPLAVSTNTVASGPETNGRSDAGPFSLVGETAVVTGGGTGLGLGIARAFVAAGAQVVLVGRRAEILSQSAADLGENATWEVHDVTLHEEHGELVQRIVDRVGSPTILVNNAGIHLKKLAVEMSAAEFAEVLQTNLIGAFSMSQAVLPGMIQRGRGNVLFVASMASLIGLPKVSAYSAAKAGIVGLVRSLAAEASPGGVRVNAIAPGWIESDMLRSSMSGDPEREAKVIARTPLNRFGAPDDVGLAATFLCSMAAKFITGVVLPVDGGASIGF